jgi:hypothetical protein
VELANLILAFAAAVLGSGVVGAIVYRAMVNKLAEEFALKADFLRCGAKCDGLTSDFHRRIKADEERLVRLEESDHLLMERISGSVIQPMQRLVDQMDRIASIQIEQGRIQERLAANLETLTDHVGRLEARLNERGR